MLVALVAGFLFVAPYLGAILFSALVAYIFNPVYKSVLKRTGRSAVAVFTAMLVAFLSVLLPAAFVIAVCVNQANSIINNFQEGDFNLGPAQVETIVDRGTERLNAIVTSLPGGSSISIDQGDITEKLQEFGAKAAGALVSFVTHAGGAFFGFISTAVLAIFLIMAMWVYQNELLAFLKKLSPFHDSVNEIYFARTGAMTKAMVKGQLVIALAQGLASALSLWLVGVDYFWFFFVVLTFLSFIPLGGGILTIPIGIILMLTGNIPRGIFVIVWHLLVVSNIDNILRPKLVPKSAQLNSALTLLSVFSGLVVFGPAGVIYGPVVMILLITTFKMYAEYNSRIKRDEPPASVV